MSEKKEWYWFEVHVPGRAPQYIGKTQTTPSEIKRLMPQSEIMSGRLVRVYGRPPVLKNIFTWNNPEKARDNIFAFNNPLSADEQRKLYGFVAQLRNEVLSPKTTPAHRHDIIQQITGVLDSLRHIQPKKMYTHVASIWREVVGKTDAAPGRTAIVKPNPAGEGRGSLDKFAKSLGLHIGTWAPGDGVTRYRFFTKPSDYFSDDGIYTALGLNEAWCFVRGYAASKTGARGNPTSAAGRDFISEKIGTLIREGYPQKQAIAIAYSMARKAGYKVPARANPCCNPRCNNTTHGHARRNPLLQTVMLANPPISQKWDKLTRRQRHAALEFAGFPDDYAWLLAKNSWATLGRSAKSALERAWATNPLTRKESASLLRDARRAEQHSRHTQASLAGRHYLRGVATGLTKAVGRHGPKSATRAANRMFDRLAPGKKRLPPVRNPGSVRIPFREGQKIPIERARAWVERYGTPELKSAFRKAEALQTKANRRPRFVTWKTLPIGDSRQIEMVTALTHYGDTPDTYYKPPKGSKKGRHLYKHSWGETGGKKSVPLLASSSGKALIMPLDGKKIAGDWLRH